MIGINLEGFADCETYTLEVLLYKSSGHNRIESLAFEPRVFEDHIYRIAEEFASRYPSEDFGVIFHSRYKSINRRVSENLEAIILNAKLNTRKSEKQQGFYVPDGVNNPRVRTPERGREEVKEPVYA